MFRVSNVLVHKRDKKHEILLLPLFTINKNVIINSSKNSKNIDKNYKKFNTNVINFNNQNSIFYKSFEKNIDQNLNKYLEKIISNFNNSVVNNLSFTLKICLLKVNIVKICTLKIYFAKISKIFHIDNYLNAINAHISIAYLLKIYILKIYILKIYSANIYTSYRLKTIITNKNILFKLYLNYKYLASKNYIFTISIYLYNINDINTIIDAKIYFLNYIHYNFILEHINSLTKNKLHLFIRNLSDLCPLENFNYLCLTDKYCKNDFLICENNISISTTKYFTSKIKIKTKFNIVILKLFKNETFHLCTSFFVLHFLHFIVCTSSFALLIIT